MSLKIKTLMSVGLATVLGFAIATSARADLMFDPSGMGGTTGNGIQIGGYTDNGANILSVNGNTAGAIGGTPFTTYFQALSANFSTPGGGSISFPVGVNTDGSLYNETVTVNLGIGEKISSVSSTATTATANLASANTGVDYYQIWLQKPPLNTSATVASGNNVNYNGGGPTSTFQSGILLLSGTLTPGDLTGSFTSTLNSKVNLQTGAYTPNPTYAGVSSVSGTGSSSLTFDVTINPLQNYLYTTNGETISQVTLTTQNATPFNGNRPPSNYVQGNKPNVGTYDGGTPGTAGVGPDFLFYGTSSGTFFTTSVPEPSTLVLSLLGLAGLGIVRMRRRTVTA